MKKYIHTPLKNVKNYWERQRLLTQNKNLPCYSPTYLTKYNLWDGQWLEGIKPKAF